MSRAEELAAKAARIKEKQAAPVAPAPSQRKKIVRSDAVRVTVDLPPTQHRALQAWTADAAETLGRARVTKQDVLTTLVARLLADPALADQIINDLGSNQ
jgi:hypothetical protein